MNEPDLAFQSKISEFLERLLQLGDDITLAYDGSFSEQIGLDSIEAFDAVATLHELLNVEIPEQFNLDVVSSISNLSNYAIRTFGQEVADRFVSLKLASHPLFSDEGAR